MFTDNTRGLGTTTKQTKPRPAASAPPHPDSSGGGGWVYGVWLYSKYILCVWEYICIIYVCMCVCAYVSGNVNHQRKKGGGGVENNQ